MKKGRWNFRPWVWFISGFESLFTLGSPGDKPSARPALAQGRGCWPALPVASMFQWAVEASCSAWAANRYFLLPARCVVKKTNFSGKNGAECGWAIAVMDLFPVMSAVGGAVCEPQIKGSPACPCQSQPMCIVMC